MLLFLAVGIGVLFLAHTAPFPFLLEAFSPSKSIWHVRDEPGRNGPPLVYLTYDDGPNPAATPALLDVLHQTGARATFFLIDAHLNQSTAPLVRRMFDEGHAVALHSDSRVLMLKTPAQLAALLTGYADRVEQLAGRRPCRLFRPHAGWRSGSMYEGLKSIDYKLVGWGWMLWDWNWFRRRTADAIVERVGARVSAGDIVVMHDGDESAPERDQRQTVEATARLIPQLKARGFRFGRVCENLSA